MPVWKKGFSPSEAKRVVRYVASIGALIMVLSIAFDTFAQQVLAIKPQLQDVKLFGENLTAEHILPRMLSYSDDAGSLAAILRLKSIITNGIIKTNTTLPGANCPTGSCTWPVTPTIGVCSECTQINATVTATSNSTCNFTTYTLPPLLGLTSGLGRSNSSLMMRTCSYFIESNWTLEESNGTLEEPNCTLEELNWKLEIDGPPFNEMIYLGRRNTTIANLYSWGVPFSDFDEEGFKLPSTDFGEGSKFPFLAYKCSFYFCVQGYFANSSLGKTNQQPIQTTAGHTHVVDDSDHDLRWVFDDMPLDLNAGPTAVFRVSEELRQNILRLFMEVLSGNVVNSEWHCDPPAAPNYPNNVSSEVASLFWQASGSLANLTALVQGVSGSLTAYMRTSDPVPAPDARFAPTVEISVQVVVVRWAWLAYPLALQLGGFIFLGMTMCATHRRRVRPWKGHRLPLLLAHLDENVRSQARGGLTHRTGLDNRIGTLRVRLEFDGDDGIAFRRVYDPPQP